MITKTAPAPVENKNALLVPYALAVCFGIMALLQLLNFEGFAQNIIAYTVLPTAPSTTLAVGIIALEIFAIPFLARLWLSKLARLCSAVAVLLAPLVWVLLVGFGIIRGSTAVNASLFGDFLAMPVGEFTFIVSLLLLGLAIWSFALLGGPKAIRAKRTK